MIPPFVRLLMRVPAALTLIPRLIALGIQRPRVQSPGVAPLAGRAVRKRNGSGDGRGPRAAAIAVLPAIQLLAS